MNSAGESSALPPVSSAGLEAALRSFQSGCLAEAERQLRLLEEAEPGRAEVAALLGQVLRAARRWPEAIACFEQALTRDPADPEPLIAIGQLHRFLGDAETARSCFEQAVLFCSWIVAAVPENPGALADLGLAYAELDDTDQAIEALRASLDLDPCLPEAHLRLGALLVKLGRLSEAEACFAALQATNPGDLQALGQGAMACRATACRMGRALPAGRGEGRAAPGGVADPLPLGGGGRRGGQAEGPEAQGELRALRPTACLRDPRQGNHLLELVRRLLGEGQAA